MCIETVLFSAAFWYAFSSAEYAHKSGARRLPLWKSVLDALNPYDLIHGVARAVMLFTGCFGGRRRGNAVQKSGPVTRSGRGRYRTVDGTESLARPDRSRSRTPLHPDVGVALQSPPRYEASQGQLSAGMRYDRAPSPGVESQYDTVRERDMV